NGNSFLHPIYYFFTKTRILWMARAWRYDNMGRFLFYNILYTHLIIADYLDVIHDTSCQLHQVISKTIIIINDYYHRSSTSPALIIASIIAFALFPDSSYSFAGTLSATIPAPAWTYTLFF